MMGRSCSWNVFFTRDKASIVARRATMPDAAVSALEFVLRKRENVSS